MTETSVPLRPPAVNTRYRIRLATPDDAPVLARQRRQMFEAMGSLASGEDGEVLEVVAREWIAREIERGTFYSWVAEQYDSGEVVAGGGLQLRPLMPRPGYVNGEPEALLLSVWTDEAHRRQGLATQVVQAMLDWCRSRGIRRVTLHASAEGRRIYERLGFTATNEMRLEFST